MALFAAAVAALGCDSASDEAEPAAQAGRAQSPSQREPAAPHVLLVTIDALRADHLGLYGYGRPVSPHLDRFATRARVHERAYAQAPHSSYSLCSLMTSEYLHETVPMGRPLPEATLPLALREAGYHTAAFYTPGIFYTDGARLERYRRDDFGFELADHESMDAEQRTDRVLAHVERLRVQGEPPSLLWVHYFDVHEPYRDTSFGTSNRDRYDGEIRKVDRAFGRLVEEAKERLERDLVIAVTADHGEEFREHGGIYHGTTLYDEQVRVPLLLQAPGLAPGRVPQPVEVVDLVPTLLRAAGKEVPASMRGRDLGAVDGRDEARAFAGVGDARMVVQWPHKLIADLRTGRYELYDLASDPQEREDRAREEPALRDALLQRLDGWLRSLLAAPGQAPPDRPGREAIAFGRLGDARVAKELAAIAADAQAPDEKRREAARQLGELGDDRIAGALVPVMQQGGALGDEAAIALGRLGDGRATARLRRVVDRSDGRRSRVRAGLALGRLGDRRALEALLEAVEHGRDRPEQVEALEWLARLGDRRAVEPLIELLADGHIRFWVAGTLGRLGDRRAVQPLLELLEAPQRTTIRGAIARALGRLGDPRAIEPLVEMVVDHPEVQHVSRALVRLRAIERGAIGGIDVRPGVGGATGLEGCGRKRRDRQRDGCASGGRRVKLRLAVPDAVRGADNEVIALLRLRRLDDGGPAEVTLAIAGHTVGTVRAGPRWGEHRLRLDAAILERPVETATLEIEGGVPLGIDHVLLLP